MIAHVDTSVNPADATENELHEIKRRRTAMEKAFEDYQKRVRSLIYFIEGIEERIRHGRID